MAPVNPVPVLVVALAAGLAAGLAGCAETCPPPQSELGQQTWAVFGRVMSLDQVPAPEWPSESLPFNGPHEWQIGWTSSGYESPVTVVIDGQTFEGNGNYDDVECGNFAISFSGSYLAEDGAEHMIGANARLVSWPENLDGFVTFNSTWVTADDASGAASGSAQLATVSDPAAATP